MIVETEPNAAALPPGPDTDPAADPPPEPTEPEPPANRAGLWIERVQISNFRGLTIDLELEKTLTVLAGRNNAGKSRILRAIGIALGDVTPAIEDLTVGSSEPATIDIVLAPAPTVTPGEGNEKVAEAQTEKGEDLADSEQPDINQEEAFDDQLGQILQPDAISQEPFRERFAWRATLLGSAEGDGVRTEFHRLGWDAEKGNWLLPAVPTDVSRAGQLRMIAGTYVDTQRDLAGEQRRAGTAVRRLLTDLDVDEAASAEITDELGVLGVRIRDESETLAAIARGLAEAEGRVPGFGSVALNALPVSLTELAQAISFDLDVDGGGPLPLRYHGLGPRSLASILVENVYATHRLGRNRPELLPHPVALIEEPEAHLHPQMQAEVPALLDTFKGQVIVSTHSSILVSEADQHALRLIRSEPTQTRSVHLKPDSSAPGRLRRNALNAAELEKVRRLVERPFGEILFASVLVIGDGASERAFLPPLLRHALGPAGHGVLVVDPESMAKAVPLAKFAETIGLPWYLFVDNDNAGRDAARSILQDLPEFDANGNSRDILVLKDVEGAIERLLCDHDEVLCREVLAAMGQDLGGTKTTVGVLTKTKGTVHRSLARSFIKKYPDWGSWPGGLKTLVTTLKATLNAEDSGDE